MKNHPLEAKLNWPKRQEQICKYSKRTYLLCFRKAYFVISLILKTPSRGNEIVYRYNTSPLVIFNTVWLLSGLEVERRFVFHVTDFIFIPASTPVGVGSILIHDNIFILIFLIISIAFVLHLIHIEIFIVLISGYQCHWEVKIANVRYRSELGV